MRQLIFFVASVCCAQSIDWTQIKNKPTFTAFNSTDYIFTRTNGKGATGDLSSAGASKVITLTPCPKLSGTDTNKVVYISGGTGTAEVVSVTGGSCTPSLSTGTLQVTTTNTHSGAWVVSSASDGIDEAIRALPAEGGVVVVAQGIHPIYSTLNIYKKYAQVVGIGKGSYDPGVSSGSELKWLGSASGTVITIQGPTEGVTLEGLRIDMNRLATTGIYSIGCERCRISYENAIVNPAVNSRLIKLDSTDSMIGNNAHSLISRNWLRGDVNGVSCIVIGPNPPSPGLVSGNWLNEISYNFCKFQGDSATSNGIEVRWSDNNDIKFNHFQQQIPNSVPGSYDVAKGSAVLLVRQALNVYLPGEDKFTGNILGGSATSSNACSGTTGDAGTLFLNYQTLDSGINGCTGALWGTTTVGQLFSTDARGWRVNPELQVSATGTDGTGILLQDDGSHSYIRGRGTHELRLGQATIGTQVTMKPNGDVVIGNTSYPTMFTVGNSGYITVDPGAFTDLGSRTFTQLSAVVSPDGLVKYCSDCAVTSVSDNTCKATGTGALAVRVNGVWRCFNAQN